jgi:hypothetical protein
MVLDCAALAGSGQICAALSAAVRGDGVAAAEPDHARACGADHGPRLARRRCGARGRAVHRRRHRLCSRHRHCWRRRRRCVALRGTISPRRRAAYARAHRAMYRRRAWANLLVHWVLVDPARTVRLVRRMERLPRSVVSLLSRHGCMRLGSLLHSGRRALHRSF